MTARAFKPSTVRYLAARARKGIMTKMVRRPRYRDLIDLIVGTYVKSLKAPLPLQTNPNTTPTPDPEKLT